MDQGSGGTPGVAVVLCFRNAGSLLTHQLEALVRQVPLDAFELVLMDNGSTDDSAAVARQWLTRFPHARLVDARACANQYDAANRAVASSGGGKVLFVDADDEVGDGYVAAMSAALDVHPIVTATLERSRLNPAWVRMSKGEDPPPGPMLWMGNVNFLPYTAGAALGTTRDVFENVGGFEPGLGVLADLDFCWKAQLECQTEIVEVPGAVLHYRYRADLGSLFQQERKYARSEVAIYRRYLTRGLRRLTLREHLFPWKRLLALLPGVLTRAGRARVAVAAGHRLGRVEGSIRERTLML